MLDIKVAFDDIIMSNVQKKDVVILHKWINSQNRYSEDEEVNFMELEELYDRFLECYISESEFFLKIYKENRLIGLIKGRLEFKNNIEAWVWCLFIEKNIRCKGIGSKVLKEFMKYVKSEYGVNDFYTTVMEKNNRIMNFWKNNGYEILRISKNYYNINGKDLDMIILKWKGKVL